MQALLLGILVGVIAITVAAAPASVERVDGSFQLRAAVPASSYAVGAPVIMTLTARNAGAARVSILFPSGQRYDAIARRPRGDEVWRWSHDRAFTQVIQTVSLAPGEEQAYRITWDQRDFQDRQVDPGTYELVVVFLGQVGGSTRQQLTLPPLTITIR